MSEVEVELSIILDKKWNLIWILTDFLFFHFFRNWFVLSWKLKHIQTPLKSTKQSMGTWGSTWTQQLCNRNSRIKKYRRPHLLSNLYPLPAVPLPPVWVHGWAVLPYQVNPPPRSSEHTTIRRHEYSPIGNSTPSSLVFRIAEIPPIKTSFSFQ